MKIKNKLTVACAALLAATMLLAGCDNGDEDKTANSTPKEIKSIGLMVQDMSNPFFSSMQKEAKIQAKKIGAKLNVQDAQLDLANQDNQISAFIEQKVDLIIVSAVDESGLKPAIERARNAGIIVVAVDTPAKGADAIITTNGVQAGNLSCTYLSEKLGGKGNILIVDGTPIQTITDRIKGCKTALKKYPGVKVVGQQASKNDRATGLSVTTDMLTANKDVQGIFGMNDPSALGASLAVEQAGRQKQIIVTGVDGSPQAEDELKRSGSSFIGTATQNPAEMVRQAVKFGQDTAKGKKPKKTTILIPSKMVTRDNVSEYKGW
ncbi:ABC transporter substrate-binding protein [Bifidobacterium sp. ESL0769]|uniref:ABC transporter substrate-binding protein n=1 Tax=Bifidobacterium sp. ESL0769 TaxID=2983229 RepID=UPI0023FA0793|nr:ABC transporter substrate-binding protein [Bifidobacterium sp. ESL0769]WEV67791.1 ABC transporter substrate-binding protein [Bifidobacterium sp. ESL0769]